MDKSSIKMLHELLDDAQQPSQELFDAIMDNVYLWEISPATAIKVGDYVCAKEWINASVTLVNFLTKQSLDLTEATLELYDPLKILKMLFE